jgi:hypothetical protein
MRTLSDIGTYRNDVEKGAKAAWLWVDIDNPGNEEYADIDGQDVSVAEAFAELVDQFGQACEEAGLPFPQPLNGDWEAIGHELLLSVHGHGSGFFDSEYVDSSMRDKYQDVCRHMRSMIVPHITDNNELGATHCH